MKRLSICLVIAGCMLAAPIAAHAGACAMPSWSPLVLTPGNQSIPSDGAVLVGAISGYGGPSSIKVNRSNPSLAKFFLRRGKHIVRFKTEVLAPGLTRYTPRPGLRGQWLLKPSKKARAFRFGSGARSTMVAPKLLKAERLNTTWKNHRGYNRTTMSMSVRITGAAPNQAVGMILYQQGRKLLPMLFKRVPGSFMYRGNGPRHIPLYTSPGRCQSRVAGTRVPPSGAMVHVRWVDRFGRLSPLSNGLRMIQK